MADCQELPRQSRTCILRRPSAANKARPPKVRQRHAGHGAGAGGGAQLQLLRALRLLQRSLHA